MLGSGKPRFRSIATALAATAAVAGAPGPASAHGIIPLLVHGAPRAAAPTIVLTLEGPEALAGPLTGSVHQALTGRGLAQPDQADLPLVEFRMTMGCEGNVPSCLAEGGKTLGAGSLAYGSVAVDGETAEVSLVLLDVGSAQVVGEVREQVPVAELEGSTDAVADRLVAQLLGEAPPPPPTADATPAPADADAGPAPASSRLVWGRYQPVPAWKWAFLGTSTALLVGSVATAAATTAIIAPKGPLRDDLLQAAEDSLKDAKASNDIDPNMDGDLCEAARAEPPGEPGKVTNADVAKICNRGDALAKVATATWITTGIFAATTIAATTLLFVRKAPAEDARAFRFGGAAGPEGGFVTASFRF